MAKTYWQIAAGSAGRDYWEKFIKFGMAFIGGDMPNELSKGDVIILKSGLNKILAVGEVVERNGKVKDYSRKDGDKDWLWDFDGWQLPSYCYVDWRVPDTPIHTDGLDRRAIVKAPQVKHQQLADTTLQLPIKPYEQEPEPTSKIDDETILKFLISEGLRPSAADELTNTFRRIRLLANYYYDLGYERWSEVREHETRSFLIIPLLIALGWAEQQIKIELPCSAGRIDVACFSKAYCGKNEECSLIVESKDFSSGLDYAPEQAKLYAKDFPSCRVVVVSNGYCYKSYIRLDSSDFNTEPSAYLNLLNPRDRYPLEPNKVKGALEVLKWLLPLTLR